MDARIFTILSRMTYLTILCMILLYIPLLPLVQYASPQVGSMDTLNYSISKFVTYVDFSKALYSSTITRLNGCCSLFSVVRMKLMMQTGALLDAVGNNHIIIVFAQTTVRMEVKPQTKVML